MHGNMNTSIKTAAEASIQFSSSVIWLEERNACTPFDLWQLTTLLSIRGYTMFPVNDASIKNDRMIFKTNVALWKKTHWSVMKTEKIQTKSSQKENYNFTTLQRSSCKCQNLKRNCINFCIHEYNTQKTTTGLVPFWTSSGLNETVFQRKTKYSYQIK